VTGEFGRDVAVSIGATVSHVLEGKHRDTEVCVEDIQDKIESVLMSLYPVSAKAFILYRDQHRKQREFADVANSDLMDQYLKQIDWKVKENANMSFSLQGLNNYLSAELSKTYWLNKIYPPEVRDAHINGDFHIHDLGVLSVYCVGWDLFDLLAVGFKGVSGKIESKPPKHFRAALGQIVNFFYTLQGEAAGAQAFSNFDTLLSPYIAYDELNRKQIKQALQEFIFNMNVPTRVGFQTPFTNITLDLTVPTTFKDKGVIIGGEVKDKTYGEFQNEMNLFNDVFLEVLGEGDARGRVFTFPIPTVNITKDFDYDNPVYQKLWKITGKYGIPYFSNFVNSDMSPDDARSMCCRLRLDTTKLEKRGGGLFGANPLTGSIGVVTINMPRIGYTSTNESQFFDTLNHFMLLARESLEIKRKILERYTDDGLYPYTKFYLRGIKTRYDEYWKNHFSTIGLVGLNEACLNLLGVTIADPKGREFGERVLSFMKDKLSIFQEESKSFYNLEATPAEGTSYRLALLDHAKYHDIIFANTERVKNGAAPFYTNSSQLPVNHTSDIFEVLDLQDGLQTIYTGGTVVHLFLGEALNGDYSSVKTLVKKVCENYKLPYFTITPTFSVCPNHGYLVGEVHECPDCGEATEIYTRIVGYLRPVQQWNKGKAEEFKVRKVLKVDE